MSAYLLSLILGIIEGLTEFLPVSSTAHLRIGEALLKVDLDNGYWKMYSVVIQLGAILSVLVLYAQRLKFYMASFPKGIDGKRSPWVHPFSLIAIGAVVTIVPAYFLHKAVEKNLSSLWVMGIALLVGGVVMWVVDAVFTRPRMNKVEEMGVLDAIWVGAVEILSAVFPGTSRSMSTIAAGQVFGMSRAAALDYSFLLSLPVMIAACGYEFLKSFKEMKADPHFVPADLGANPWVVLAIGFIVSFIVALGVNRWFIGWVKKHGFAPFAVWRILVGIGVIVWAARG